MQKNFRCIHCPNSYANSTALSRHLTRSHGQGFECKSCDEVLPTMQSYVQHKLGHGKRSHKCSFCTRVFSNRKSCTIHERVHTGEKPYQCVTCMRAFTQKSHLSDHERTHSGARPFACNQCNLAFTTHSSRRRHQRTVHCIGEKPSFPCSVCGVVLSTRYSINLHMRKHTKGLEKTTEKKYFCKICETSFASSTSLRRHLKHMHDNVGTSSLCTICNLSYHSETTLNQHLLRAHGVPSSSNTVDSITCDECGALMQTQNGILIHKKRCHDKSATARKEDNLLTVTKQFDAAAAAEITYIASSQETLPCSW